MKCIKQLLYEYIICTIVNAVLPSYTFLLSSFTLIYICIYQLHSSSLCVDAGSLEAQDELAVLLQELALGPLHLSGHPLSRRRSGPLRWIWVQLSSDFKGCSHCGRQETLGHSHVVKRERKIENTQVLQ
jgi:hypothetical protein